METIKEFFTDDEWSAIESALQDYQDYGDEEAEIVSAIETKLYNLFKDT